MKGWIFGILAALCLAVTLVAHDKTPALTDVQKLQFQNAALRYQMAQMQMQAAQREAEALVQSFQVPGWTLDMSTLVYTKSVESPKAEGATP